MAKKTTAPPVAPSPDSAAPAAEKTATLIVERRALADLIPHPDNPRDHPPPGSPEYETLKASIEHDYFQPIEINQRNGMIVGGHLRCKVMLDLGYTHAMCVICDYDEATHKARLIAANKQAGTDNQDALDRLLTDLRASEVDPVLALMASLGDEPPQPPGGGDAPPEIDRAEELNKKWQVKPGDVWQIGDHRLMCGSSTDNAHVAKLMGGGTPRLMVTDPPYGVNLDQSWRDVALGAKALGKGNKMIVANDDRADWTGAWALFGGDVVYVWHASKFADVVMASLRTAGFDICQHLIWNKSVMVMGRSDYHFKHEPCWYAVRKGKAHGWIGDRKQTTVIEAKSPNHIMSGSDEIQTEHPTQKPAECMTYLIRNHAGDVYDPFLGSGTTMVAAQNLGRKCFGMEISPNYCAVILERMATAFPGIVISRVEA